MSNNNVSDGPIPFFSSDDNNSNFLSGANITDNPVSQTQKTQQTQPTQSTQPVQSTQPTQQSQTQTTTAPKQSVQDVSSLFGNNKEDSFLSSINSQNIQNNAPLPTSNSLYYNQANNGSNASLRSLTQQQPYSNSYIPKSESNPQSINSSSSYTNLAAFNQTNNTTANVSGYNNINTLNKSPYISSPEPNAATYNTSGTPASSYAQGFYANPATQGSQSNLSSYSKNYAATASNSSLNSFQSPQKTQSYPPPNYSNMYNQDQTKTATKNYSTYQQSYYNNTSSYLSPSSNNSAAATPTPAHASIYGANASTAATGYSTSQTGTSTPTPGYVNTTQTSTTSGTVTGTTTGTTATGYTNTQTGTTTATGTATGYTNTQTGTTASAGSTTTGYTNTQTSTTTASGNTATGYTNTQTSTTTATSNTATSYTNTQTGTTTASGYGTTQNSTTTGYTTTGYTNTTNTYSNQDNSTASGYSTPQPKANTGYTTNQSTTSYQSTGTGYQTSQNATTTNAGYSQTGTLSSKFSPYPQAATTKDNSVLNTSASYSSLNNLAATANNTTTTASAALPPKDTSMANQTSGFTNYANNSSSQINYYSNTSTNLKNDVPNPAAPSIRSNTPGALSLNDLTADTTNLPTGVNLYSATSPNSGSIINSSTSLNESIIENSAVNTPNPGYSSLYYQNKNTQGFYSNVATSSSSPCLNSMGTAYPASTTSSIRKNSYNDSAAGKHVKSNSVMSPGSTYQNSLYANNNGSVADNISFTGSVGSKNEPVASSLYYHDENNGKFRSPTAPPSSDNAAKLSPSSTNANLNRPPSVPPNYVSYNYGKSTATASTATTTTWKPNATPNLSYSSYTTPTPSSYANTTTYPTSTTPNPYQPDTTAYSTSTTPNPYPTSTTPNPYQPDTTQYYNSTTDASGTQGFYNFDNQSQGEIHSCDPIVMHQNLSPIISFGFGGKLVVMFPKDLSGTSFSNSTVGPNTVHVKPISSVIYPNIIEDHKEMDGPILGQKKNKKQILEMLTKKINKIKSKETHYNSYSTLNSSDSDEVLILKVIQLYIENDGVVYGQNSKPEAVQHLRSLLLSDPTPVNTTHTMINGPSVNSSEIENIKNCLLQGDRPGACKIAVNNKLWAHALIIASYINKETYKDVVNSFIKSELQGENESQKSSFQSIKVLYSLFAGMGKDAIIDTSSTMPLANSLATQSMSTMIPSTTVAPSTTTNSTNEVVGKWKEILGMILSNRTPNDVSAIVSLGDALLSYNKLTAAHLCYLFSPSSISGLNGKTTKAVLLGADHHKNKNFYKNLNAFQNTEFLEYMYYMANKNMSTMPHFQAYKLVYANWLADIGLVNKAFNYAQCIMQIIKSGTNNNNNNGTISSSIFYNQTLFENLKEFTNRCQGHFSGTKNAPKDGWFSKITKFDTFLEAFDHGLNKFIGTTDSETVPNISSTPQPSTTTNPVPMMPTNSYNNTTVAAANLGLKNSSSYQSVNQTYYKNSYSTDNVSSAQGSRKNSFSKDNQKGVFSIIGNLFNKGSNAPTTNNSSTNSLTNQDESNKNGYYDSITKQWVNTNTQVNDKFGNDITAPPPAASDFYNQGYNTTGMNNAASSGTLSNGVIPQFNSMGSTTGMTNPRRNNRTKYNDPTLNMAYSNTTTNQAQNGSTVPPPLYSNTTGTTLDNQNNSTYTGYNYYGN